VSLPAVGVASLATTEDKVITQVYDGCTAYFKGNPYRQWFTPLNKILNGFHASYWDGTAAHLDLVHWATDPVWRDLNRQEQNKLLEDGAPFLKWQVGRPHLRLLLVNGRTVLNCFRASTGIQLKEVRTIPGPQGKRATLYQGDLPSGGKVIGWSTNLQSSRGVTTTFKQRLAQEVLLLGQGHS
jgi:hypothetical protein